MSRTYRDQRRWKFLHAFHWDHPWMWRWEGICPWREVPWSHGETISQRYTRRTRQKAKDALRHGDFESIDLVKPRRYNSHE